MLSTKTILLLLVAIVLVVYITNYNNSSKNSNNSNNNNSSNNSANNVSEGFMNDTDSPVNESYVGSGYSGEGFENPREGFKEHENGESEEMEEMEEAMVNQREGFENQPANNNAKLPAECYPKDVLNSSDLLPSSQSLHAQVVPSGAGSLGDKNFLNAGYHIGINTVGQSLRNANRQLRSEPPNPQVKVSPWMQTTIEADINRKPLEIGS